MALKNQYMIDLLETVKKRNQAEPEFIQAVTEVFESLEAVIDRRPDFVEAGILDRMRRSDVLVFPSLFEGFGLVILEAMAQGVPVIDIRTEPEWRATGVLAGSRALTFFDAQGRADPASWLRRAQAFAPPEKPVILICRSGNRSRAAAQVLSREGGYGRVYNVSRGVQGWAGEGRPFVAPTSACLAGERC